MGLFRHFFGFKDSRNVASPKRKRRWSFSRSTHAHNRTTQSTTLSSLFNDTNAIDHRTHAISVAAATAAVAEAALAAAQAAAEVVRLTSQLSVGLNSPSTECVSRPRRVEILSATTLQSAFRGYLARRALRALKSLVKLQALVRGNIVRKQSADMLRRMQALVRVQNRARVNRTSQSFHHPKIKPGCDSVEVDDDKNGKILEVDTWEPNLKAIRRNRKLISCESPSKWSYKFQASPCKDEQSSYLLSSPLEASRSSGRGPLTPTRSESTWGIINGSPCNRNYMAETESSRAKVRSHSAPRLRMELDRLGVSRRSHDAHNISDMIWEQSNDFEQGTMQGRSNAR